MTMVAMGSCCDLEVDVNGEETFMVNKNIVSCFSRRCSNLFGNLKGANKNRNRNRGFKVIFNDFPGGPRGFELILRFCYSSRMVITFTPSNIVLLYCAAHFMQMQSVVPSGKPNLISQIDEFLAQGIHFWTWSELLEALTQCQHVHYSGSVSAIWDRIVGHLIDRLVFPSLTTPYTCSSNSSSFQFSCDSFCSGPTSWWFNHLLFLNIDLLDKLIRTMISHDFSHALLSKFLFYFHKLGSAKGRKTTDETTQVVVNLLSLLDKSSLSFKDFFNFYQISVRLKISTCCKNQMEILIGSMVDQATIDYLLLPSPQGSSHAYDVGFALRIMQIFVDKGNFGTSLIRLKRVTKMMDSFLVEVAPDSHLKSFEFTQLITVLPDVARESHDQLYLAIDMYLKVHAGLSEKEKMSICSALKYEKLSAELVKHLTRNLVFPAETKPRAHARPQSRMKSLLQENDHLKSFLDSVFRKSFKNKDASREDDKTRDSLEVKPMGDLKVMQSVVKSGLRMMSNNRH